MSSVRREGPAQTVAGFLAAVSIFVSAAGAAYRPLRLIPFAILLALISAAMGGSSSRLPALAAGVGAFCFALGMAIAVITKNPLY